MTPSHLALLALPLFPLLARAATLNYTGTALTTRYWDCCKPSCGWKGKAFVTNPVGSCSASDAPIAFDAGTGCNGGTAFACSQQQPWAVNASLAYGYAGVFLTKDVVGDKTEDAWCCACYQLDFTEGELKGKRMVVQASNTAYDVTSTNRFSIAVPGGNTTAADGCATQYSVPQSVFGTTNSGVATKDDCQNLPEAMRPACEWRFDWMLDAEFPVANFKRVPCPSAISDRTGCVRNDDKELEAVLAGNVTASSGAAGTGVGRGWVLGVVGVLGLLGL